MRIGSVNLNGSATKQNAFPLRPGTQGWTTLTADRLGTAVPSGYQLSTQADAPVIWTGSQYVVGGAVQIGPPFTQSPEVYTSSDGVSWTRRPVTGVTNWTFGPVVNIASNGTGFVVTGVNGGRAAYTTNFTTWTDLYSAVFTTAGVTDFLYDVVWNGQYFCLVGGSNGNNFARSTDGLTWTGYATLRTALATRGQGNPTPYAMAAWGNKLVVAAGFGEIAYSADSGATWTYSSNFYSTFGGAVTLNHGLAMNSSVVVYVTNQAYWYYSLDGGATWNPTPSPAPFSAKRCEWTGKYFVAYNDNSTDIAWSTDGINWQTSVGDSSTTLRMIWNGSNSTLVSVTRLGRVAATPVANQAPWLANSIRPEAAPDLGSFYQGGYYIGTATYNGTTYRLILAPKSTEGLSQFKTSNTASTGADSQFDGLANTNALNTASHPACQYARSLTTNGYTDWYVPAYWEYIGFVSTAQNLLPPSQQFSNNAYWGSWTDSADQARIFNPVTGSTGNTAKTNGTVLVRPIRRVAI